MVKQDYPKYMELSEFFKMYPDVTFGRIFVERDCVMFKDKGGYTSGKGVNDTGEYRLHLMDHLKGFEGGIDEAEALIADLQRAVRYMKDHRCK